MGQKAAGDFSTLRYLALNTSKNDTHKSPLLCTYNGSGCWGAVRVSEF